MYFVLFQVFKFIYSYFICILTLRLPQLTCSAPWRLLRFLKPRGLTKLGRQKSSYSNYSSDQSSNFWKTAWGDQSRISFGRKDKLWEKIILISRAANNHFGRIKTEKNGKRCWNLSRRSIFGYFFRRQNTKNCRSSTQTRLVLMVFWPENFGWVKWVFGRSKCVFGCRK